MIKQIFFHGITSLLVMTSVAAEGRLDLEECLIQTDPFRPGLRHREAKGIGYNQGYTTLETFFVATEAWGEPWIPFLDARGHLFNNASTAANIGVGLRFLDARVWGINGYCDYRKTHSMHYHQVSLGIESLGRVWDFRLNGYLPFGRTKQRFSHSASKRKREYALKSGNMEVGVHIDRWEKMPLYCAGGPYHLSGHQRPVWGGELRASIDLFHHVRLQAITSYDSLFKWIAQGELGLFMSWGGKKEIQRKKDGSCVEEQILRDRALSPVNRSEIIPVGHQHE